VNIVKLQIKTESSGDSLFMVWLSLAMRMAKGKARLLYYLLHKWKDQSNDFISKFTDKLEL